MYYAISGGVQTGNIGVCLLDIGSEKRSSASDAKNNVSFIKAGENTEIDVTIGQGQESILQFSMSIMFPSQHGISCSLFFSASVQQIISLMLLKGIAITG